MPFSQHFFYKSHSSSQTVKQGCCRLQGCSFICKYKFFNATVIRCGMFFLCVLITIELVMGGFRDFRFEVSRAFSPRLAFPCKSSVCRVQGTGLIPADWKAPLVWRCDHSGVCLNPVDFLRWQAYLAGSSPALSSRSAAITEPLAVSCSARVQTGGQ